MRLSLYLSALVASGLTTGCLETLQLAAPGGGGGRWYPDRFWPPPTATSVWVREPCAPAGDGTPTFGGVAAAIHDVLTRAGYLDERWLAVGAGFTHGFAVVTRLERMADDGAPYPASARFAPAFAEAPTLEWLDGARAFASPAHAPARFRVFLIAVTDLPFERQPHRAPIWNADTWLGEAPPADFPAQRRTTPRYGTAIYLYEYEATNRSQGDARFVSGGASALAAGTQVAMAGLASVPCPSDAHRGSGE